MAVQVELNKRLGTASCGERNQFLAGIDAQLNSLFAKYTVEI